MLKLKNITAGYYNNEVINNLTLEVGKGEIVAIVGPNGSGKSTVLKSIFSLAQVFSGNILFENKEITNLLPNNIIKKGISYVPQGRQVFEGMTVGENLEMGAFIFEPAEAKKRIDELIDSYPLFKERWEDLADTLSGGQQQLLAFGRALVQKPRLLLLDEPSLGIDPKTALEIFALIKKLNKQGVTLVIVEQNARHAISIAHRTIIIENGTIVKVGDKKLLDDEEMKKIYFGNFAELKR